MEAMAALRDASASPVALRPKSSARRRIAPQAIARFKARGRELTRRTGGKSLAQIVKEPFTYLVGWRGYFRFCQTPSVLRRLDEWIRRRLRAIAWKRWKRRRTRVAELRRRGVGRVLAAQTAGSPHGPWRLAAGPALNIALPNPFLGSLGLASVAVQRPPQSAEPPYTDPDVRWRGRGEVARLPPIPIALSYCVTQRPSAPILSA